MLRLVGFFFLVLLLLAVLRQVPVIGGVFQIPLIGFWLTVVLVSAGTSKLAAYALDRRKQHNLVRRLGAVDTPHNAGKLGSLQVQQGRYRVALPNLEKAVAGEPDSAEWNYRLGLARLGSGDSDGADAVLSRAVELNEEHAYGQVMLALADARTRSGMGEEAMSTLERFERNHGSNPESAYRRGKALAALGRKDEARAAFGEVSKLAGELASYQRRGAIGWVMRAFFARLVTV